MCGGGCVAFLSSNRDMYTAYYCYFVELNTCLLLHNAIMTDFSAPLWWIITFIKMINKKVDAQYCLVQEGLIPASPISPTYKA